MKRAVVTMLALMLGAASFQAQAGTVLGGDPGVFKAHEMELLINKNTGGMWIVTEQTMPRNATNYSAGGNGWAAFSVRDLSGDAVMNVQSVELDPIGDPGFFTTIYGGNTPRGTNNTPAGAGDMQALNMSNSYVAFGVPTGQRGIDFTNANVANAPNMTLFNTADPDPAANPFKGKLSFFLGNLFTRTGAAFAAYDHSDLRFEWGGRFNGEVFSNVANTGTGTPDITFFGTPPSAVPEPATMALLGMGGLALLRRRAAKA